MEKVVVPQFVADYIENNYEEKPNVWDKADLIRDFDMYIESYNNSSLEKWVKNDVNFLTLITAIITNDYEVEEKKYYWRKKKEYMFEFELPETSYLRIFSGTKGLMFSTKAEGGKTQARLTETQVRLAVSEEDFNKLEKVEITE